MKVMVVVYGKGHYKHNVGRVVINKGHKSMEHLCISPNRELLSSSYCSDWRLENDEIFNRSITEWTLEPLNDRNINIVEAYYKNSLEKILRYGERYET